MTKPFASEADLEEKEEILEVLADGVYALTAGGDPTVGAIEGDDFLICFEARATPYMAGRWLEQLRQHTDKPVRYLVLSHYHAVRTLGAAAFDAEVIVAHQNTKELIAERGMEDWASEAGRMPRLFQGAEGIPGLTWPTATFTDRMTVELGADRGIVELAYLGRGHTRGDIVAWMPHQRVMFAGDLVESEAALYTGDAYHLDWMTTTLDRVAALDAETLVGGRGRVVHGPEVGAAIEQTRGFLLVLKDSVESVQQRGGTLKDAFTAAHAALAPKYGGWPIFEHTLPFDVSRIWDELAGANPRIWTAERDRALWDELQS
ncbi:MAG: MBL fold metallo-hydrolase [Acidimicrobiia bacterium]|nr:MBL fold metallo-hydrolase [Acidimicrobiia bacterium]